MSASLVGSEMCIRDSITTYTALWRLSGLPCMPSARASSRDCGSGSQQILCLLYTSDAADDM
eukprot:7431430-Alexandrium_andersonii.AAC.1